MFKTEKSDKDFDKLIKASEMLRAISYPYRLEILRFLDDGEYHQVNEIQAYLDIEATLLSHHLAKLRDKGILEKYREGRYIYYKLIQKELLKVLDCISKCKL